MNGKRRLLVALGHRSAGWEAGDIVHARNKSSSTTIHRVTDTHITIVEAGQAKHYKHEQVTVALGTSNLQHWRPEELSVGAIVEATETTASQLQRLNRISTKAARYVKRKGWKV